MNVELIRPNAIVALLGSARTDGAAEGLVTRARRSLAARLREEWRYLVALGKLSRLDQRDLDDLAIGWADLPGLARRHARGALLPA